MKTLKQHKDEQSHALRSAKDLMTKAEKEDRRPTSEEVTEINEWIAVADEAARQVVETEKFLAAKTKTEERLQALETPLARKTVPAQPTNGHTESRAPDHKVHRYGKLRCNWGPTVAEAEENAYRSGMWYLATFLGNQRSQRWCEMNGVEVRALSTNVNTAGGNLVPDEFEAAIIKLREDHGVFRRFTRVLPMGTDHIFIPRRSGGITATFTAENAALTESDPSWNNVELTAKKLGALTRFSTELAEDSLIDIADIMAEEFALALALKEDTVGFVGTGVVAHGGIEGIFTELNTNEATYAGSVNATSGNDKLGDITTADLGSLMGALPQYAVPNAKFYCSSVVNEVVFGRLMVAGGGNTMRDLSEERRPSYLGHEIVVSQVLPAGDITTNYNNAHFVIYGDLTKSSTMGERRGITVGTSDQRYFIEDQIAMKVTQRFDINNHDLGDASTAGPMVGLKGNT